MWILESIILALSLCADCFAVATCSSISLKRVSWKEVLPIALIFSLVHIILLLLGWFFGDIFVGYLHKVADVIGFLLLLYVGGSMILEAMKGEERVIDLGRFKNILMGALATSLDAFAVGVSLSMCGTSGNVMAANVISLFLVTMAVVSVGVFGGARIGRRFGRTAEIIGGIVLIGIGICILAGIF